MWIKANGKIVEDVYQLSTPVSTHILLITSEGGILFDTSIYSFASYLKDQVEEILEVYGLKLTNIFLTHCDFDHIGGLPYLQSAFPEAKLLVSPKIASLMQKESFLRDAYDVNKRATEALSDGEILDFDSWKSQIEISRVIGDSDSLLFKSFSNSREIEIRLLSVPGHSKESTAYFILPFGLLISDETLGAYSGRDNLSFCFREKEEVYLKSIDKLSALDIKIISLPHSGVLTGDLAKKHLLDLRVMVVAFSKRVKDLIGMGRVFDEIFSEIKIEWEEQGISPEGPFQFAQEGSLKETIKAIIA